MRTRLTRDRKTGESFLYDIDTGDRVIGNGILSSIGNKIMTKLTGQVVNDLTKKAATKVVEQIGKKTGDIIANKIEKTFGENKGAEIITLLKNEQSELSQQFNKLLM